MVFSSEIAFLSPSTSYAQPSSDIHSYRDLLIPSTLLMTSPACASSLSSQASWLDSGPSEEDDLLLCSRIEPVTAYEALSYCWGPKLDCTRQRYSDEYVLALVKSGIVRIGLYENANLDHELGQSVSPHIKDKDPSTFDDDPGSLLRQYFDQNILVKDDKPSFPDFGRNDQKDNMGGEIIDDLETLFDNIYPISLSITSFASKLFVAWMLWTVAWYTTMVAILVYVDSLDLPPSHRNQDYLLLLEYSTPLCGIFFWVLCPKFSTMAYGSFVALANWDTFINLATCLPFGLWIYVWTKYLVLNRSLSYCRQAYSNDMSMSFKQKQATASSILDFAFRCFLNCGAAVPTIGVFLRKAWPTMPDSQAFEEFQGPSISGILESGYRHVRFYRPINKRSSQSGERKEFARTTTWDLPHITIQMPVYKENFGKVITPTVKSLKLAMARYERSGGTSSIFVKNDGMSLAKLELSERDRFSVNMEQLSMGTSEDDVHDKSHEHRLLTPLLIMISSPRLNLSAGTQLLSHLGARWLRVFENFKPALTLRIMLVPT
ncbi:uncharacterized protein LY89DRAFT_375071 [Mollisia scopiformis]|uniref:Uncharacterized protein n=1 Tax=Mollisia scopiformis TaxID=149040 RepID=A0A132B5R3_MOLSC|nr:uncharacterized protein LY89DRAFT_375071 [Mollisia scopiformis]KUJ07007.1 hypothetical protein LY89DRAFT_375071 [Mollisia scopiformis]